MSAPVLSIESSPSLPKQADAVIIGAGIVGVFTAYYLAKRGLKVALLEKGKVGGEQSSRNWGWCRQQNRDARELPISTQSLNLWETFAAESGEDTGFTRCGLLYLSNDEQEIDGWAQWCEFARTVGVQSHILSSQEAMQHGLATEKSWKGGVFSPTDGIADPARAAPVVARALTKLGGSVHQECAARGIETAGGRISAVVTEYGPIRTPVAILAGGAWASSFCRQLDIRFPQATTRLSILSVSTGVEGIPDALHTKDVSVTRRGKDAYTLAVSGLARVDPTPQMLFYGKYFIPMFAKRWRSLKPGGTGAWTSGHETLKRWQLDEQTPMERVRVLDPKPDTKTISETHRKAVELLPILSSAQISGSWAGYIDSTPDGVPAIGEIETIPGLILAAGFSGHGFGIGPGAGHLVADIITGLTPIVDPDTYTPGRFASSAWGNVADF